MTMQPPVVIGDAASLARDIAASDLAIGWKTTGLPADAVSLDTWQDLFELRLRAILTAIIQSDAPTGLTLTSFGLINTTTIRLEYTLAGHTAHLDVPLAALFATVPPANIGLSANDGDTLDFPHGNHVHRMPTRAVVGETPIVGLEHIITAPTGGRGKRLGFNAATGEPEYQDPSTGNAVSTADPQAVGGPNAPAAGTDTDPASASHEHDIAARSVGLPELMAAALATDYGKVIGYDPTTGEPVALASGQSSFAGLIDTPAALGATGQAPVVDSAGTALEFAGPFQPLAAPSAPTSVRATDAFDGFLEVAWAADPDAASYEYQRKESSATWPSGTGTPTTATSVRNSTGLPLGSYDFRVRAVSPGGHLRSSWTEVLNIPVIATPTPATSATHRLSRLRSRALTFSWDSLDVSNGGTGAGRVVKAARYEYQYREFGVLTWPGTVENSGQIVNEIDSLTNGQLYEARVRGVVRRSDSTMTDIDGPYSGVSNSEKPVKTTVTLTYGVAPTRTGVIASPRTLELRPGVGSQIEITNALHPAASGEFYALDIDRGDRYAQNYNIVLLETRPLPTDITAGADYMEEVEPASGPRRFSVGPSVAISTTQLWQIEVN